MTIERQAIESALKDSDDNIGRAAEKLGASRRTLQNRMRQYGMPRGRGGRRKKLLPYAGRQKRLAALGAAAALALGFVVYRSRTV